MLTLQKLLILASTLLFTSSTLNADITIKPGWQLLGATQDLNTSIFDISCVDYIWKYDANVSNTEWQVHVANDPSAAPSYTHITSFDKGEGYWVLGNADCNITIPEPVVERYSRSASGVVTDHDTYLQWQDNIPNASLVAYNWLNGGYYCDNLILDGIGWRLPSIYELESIVDTAYSDPSIKPVFVHTISYMYWSSTTDASYTSGARIVHFLSGVQGGYDKTYQHPYVRCVRAGQ